MEDTQNAQKQKQRELQGPVRGNSPLYFFFLPLSSVDHIHRQTGAVAVSNKEGGKEEYVEQVNIPKLKAKDDDDDEANHRFASLQGKFDNLLLGSFRMAQEHGHQKTKSRATRFRLLRLE